jgi:hypothetical protein
MVFTRTCEAARRLALQLRNLGFDALPIHGQMSQPKRLGALNKFKAGERSILVATGGVLFPSDLFCRIPCPDQSTLLAWVPIFQLKRRFNWILLKVPA